MSNQGSQIQQSSFWSVPASEVLRQLQTTPKGLADDEAERRLKRYDSNLLKPKKRSDAPTLLIAQFKSPIILILIFAGGLSFFLGDAVDALIILMIILISGLLGFWQERGARVPSSSATTLSQRFQLKKFTMYRIVDLRVISRSTLLSRMEIMIEVE